MLGRWAAGWTGRLERMEEEKVERDGARGRKCPSLPGALRPPLQGLGARASAQEKATLCSSPLRRQCT